MKILLSTDVLGVLGNARDIDKAYSDAKKVLGSLKIPLNLEIIAWKHVYNNFLKFQEMYGYKVLGVHGRMGSFESPSLRVSAILKTMNRMLIGNNKLKEIGLDRGYVLVHEGEYEYFLENKCMSLLMIENNPTLKSLKRTVEVVNKLNNKQETGIMVDLVHTIKETTGESNLNNLEDFSSYFGNTLDNIHKKVRNIETVGFHVSIGDNHDSLPLNEIKKSDWKLFAELVNYYKNKCQFLVFENQHNISQVYLSEKKSKAISNKTARTLETLAECGVIK